MADDELPGEYDVIVLGTGLTESILAAAVARSGKTILHLDRNDHYGGCWATFSFETLRQWIQDNKTSSTLVVGDDCEVQKLFKDGEKFLRLPQKSQTIRNMKEEYFVSEAPAVDETEHHNNNLIEQMQEVLESNEISAAESLSDLQKDLEDEEEKMEVEEETSAVLTEQQIAELTGTKESAGISDEKSDVLTEMCGDFQIKTQISEEKSSGDIETESSDKDFTFSIDGAGDSLQEEKIQKVWTLADFRKEWRKFNLDLAPKPIFSNGELVQLLISSNIAKYAEFKSFTQIHTVVDGRIEQIPCSRADVFNNMEFSLLEKRLMMKFLTFCLKYQNSPQEFEGYEQKSFKEFLASKKLPNKIQHFILSAIGMVSDDSPTLIALSEVQKFLLSIGRYGDTPFLWPIYGVGELPQCFCRMCAVYGGIYYLKRAAEGAILDTENRVTAIVSRGRRLDCKWLIAEHSYAPDAFLPSLNTRSAVSRGIFLTDKSAITKDRHQLALLTVSRQGKAPPIVVIELGYDARACPEGLYVLQMTCEKVAETPEEDLRPAVETLMKPYGFDDDQDKPSMLWSLYFTVDDVTHLDLNSSAPSNVVIVAGVSSMVGLEHSVIEAESLFKKMFPDEEFLPAAPTPPEGVLDDDL